MPWTTADCVAALRAAAPDDGSPLLHDCYVAWRREHPGHPSALTIVRLHGTWADALAAAGVPSARKAYEPHGPP